MPFDVKATAVRLLRIYLNPGQVWHVLVNDADKAGKGSEVRIVDCSRNFGGLKWMRPHLGRVPVDLSGAGCLGEADLGCRGPHAIHACLRVQQQVLAVLRLRLALAEVD